MRDLTNQEMMKLTGFDPGTISNFIRRGEIVPKRIGKNGLVSGGKHEPSLWSPTQALGLALCRGSRMIGVSSNYSLALLRAIAGMTEAKLEAEFAAGRTHIGSIGDFAYPALVTKSECLEDKAFTAKSLTVLGDLPRGIDVQRVWANMKRAVSEIDSQYRPLLEGGNRTRTGIVPRAEQFSTELV